jgi:hypothetical protein
MKPNPDRPLLLNVLSADPQQNLPPTVQVLCSGADLRDRMDRLDGEMDLARSSHSGAFVDQRNQLCLPVESADEKFGHRQILVSG